MAYNKASAVAYAYYEIVSSYFKSYKVVNKISENSLFLHFHDAKVDMQYKLEDYAIYSVEEILPNFIGKVDLNSYACEIKMNSEKNIVTVKTTDFAFDAVCDFVNNVPSITYANIVKKKS